MLDVGLLGGSAPARGSFGGEVVGYSSEAYDKRWIQQTVSSRRSRAVGLAYEGSLYL